METNNKELNKRIEKAISRISGKPTVGKVLKMFLVDPPSQDYLKAYLKRWY
jgi:hypothetical protein